MSNEHIAKKTKSGRLFFANAEYEHTREKLESKVSKESYINLLSQAALDETFEDSLIKLTAVSIISDGVHQNEEWSVCKDICEELQIHWDFFQELVTKELDKINQSTEFDLEEYIRSYLIDAKPEHAFLLFEIALHIILADGIMTIGECKILAAIGETLKVPTARMLARLGLFLREEVEILVDVEDKLKWQATTYVFE